MESAAQLYDFIEAYESAQERDGGADLAAFLPPRDHLLYDSVLRELVRVDLEYAWQRRAPRSLEEYRQHFPELFARTEDVEAIAYEEYRLRRQAGEPVSREDYARRYGIATECWPDRDTQTQESPSCPGECDASTARVDNSTGFGTYALNQAARWLRRIRHRRYPDSDAAHGDSPEAELFRGLLTSNPAAAEDLVRSTLAPPRVGTDFLGFHLDAVLGSGAFGHVFLARQGELANRNVALKVTARLCSEPQTLAQLQHTHIVPIYSVHVQAPFQAVCMPYLGSTTCADLLHAVRAAPRLPESPTFIADLLAERRRSQAGDCETTAVMQTESRQEPEPAIGRLDFNSYVEQVLWMGECLAEGLAHAHDRGIVHRDLKPANVLVTDDGLPMLLDFNLAEDRKLRAMLPAAIIGGTVPYMAPECLQALIDGREGGDPRSDLYSLGVILFELLTGQHPYALPKARSREAVKRMIEERLRGVPRLRTWNRAVSGAAEAIVRKCLEPNPGRRYAGAHELAEDLRRQRELQPLRFASDPVRERLRKWTYRHPRFSTAAAVATVGALALIALLGLFAARNERLAVLEAHAGLEAFRRDLGPLHVQLLSHQVADPEHYAEIGKQCQSALARYGVLEDPAWQERPAVARLEPEERAWLGRELSELLLLCARVAAVEHATDEALRFNELASACIPGAPPAVARRQRAELNRLAGRHKESKALPAHTKTTVPSTARELCLEAAELVYKGSFAAAVPLLRRAGRLEPQNFRIWFDLGICQEHLGRDAEAATAFDTAIALAPQIPQLYYKRGAVHLRAKRHEEAAGDFTEALRRQEPPGITPALLAEIYLERALAHLGMKDLDRSLQDLERAMELPCPTRAYFVRAIVRARRGDAEGAQRDREDGLRRTPRDEQSWLARGWARLHEKDAAGALDDFERALARNPRSIVALQNQAHVLAEYLGRTQDAIQALDRQLELAPDLVRALAGRGVLHARLGHRKEALADATAALQRDNSPATMYQVAGIYALTSQQESEDRPEAYRLLAGALRKGHGWNLIPRDRDLDPIREQPDFKHVLESIRQELGQSRR